MATPKKKHLIELMIEADVKWPDGAKYAAQDKDTMRVRFYRKGKPLREVGADYWSSSGGSLITGVMATPPELCHNWHQTIVTKAQYEAAVAEKLNVDEQPETAESQPCGAATPATIEQRITELQVMERNLAELRAELHEMERNLDEFSDKLTDDIHALGITWLDGAVEQNHEPKPEQPVITTWRDLRVGDEIECIEPWGGYISHGDIGTITRISSGGVISDFTSQNGYKYETRHFGIKFRFISRP